GFRGHHEEPGARDRRALPLRAASAVRRQHTRARRLRACVRHLVGRAGGAGLLSLLLPSGYRIRGAQARTPVRRDLARVHEEHARAAAVVRRPAAAKRHGLVVAEEPRFEPGTADRGLHTGLVRLDLDETMIDGVMDAAEIRRVVAESERPAVRGHQGDLHLGEVDGHRIFVKAATGNPLAAAVRRWMLRREYEAYRRLEDVPGIPRCYGFYDGRYLVMDAIDGRSLRDAVIHDREQFFGELFAIVDAMHARGVAHGDLMRKDNILVDRDEHPMLVDFGASTIYRRGFH